MVLTKKRTYHPIVGLMPSPLEEVPEELGWYHEKWATPYMAAVARVVFRRKESTMILNNRVYHPVGGLMPSPLKEAPYIAQPQWEPDVTLTPQVGAEKIIEGVTGLGAELKAGEWLKENPILVIVVVIALVLLYFFLK